MTPADISAAETLALQVLAGGRGGSKPRPASNVARLSSAVLALVAEVRRRSRLEQPSRVPASAFERWRAAGCPGEFVDWAAGEGR